MLAKKGKAVQNYSSRALDVKSLVTDEALVRERRAQIVAGAVKLFSKNGYDRTTVQQVAKKAGVSTGLIYQYVRDKEDLLSVFDDPTDGRSFGATSVDSEGQTCRPLPLIDQGVLGGFLHNTYTGRRSGEGTTANGVRGYRSSPGVGAHAVIMSPGSGILEDIIEDVDLGVLVTSMSGLHSGVNAISGDFSVGLDGLMIRNGVLSEPIREATIASTIQKMLTDIVAVGADTEWQPGGSGPVSLAIADVSMSGA